MDSTKGGPAIVIVCDVRALVDPDLAAVDTLARLHLVAKRLGYELRLSNACDPLRELLELAGLTEIVPLCEGSGVESRGQTE
jgi:hypothetical protein